MIIRSEQPADVAAIFDLTAVAFRGRPHSAGTEPYITDALRDAGALRLSLVAERDGVVVGHVAFSPVTISDGSAGWYGLGPIAVLPEWQRQGVGTALIREGLARLKSLGAAGCVLLGDPRYYSRFGFANDPALVYEGAPAQYFMALAFDSRMARGIVRYHTAFDITV